MFHERNFEKVDAIWNLLANRSLVDDPEIEEADSRTDGWKLWAACRMTPGHQSSKNIIAHHWTTTVPLHVQTGHLQSG